MSQERQRSTFDLTDDLLIILFSATVGAILQAVLQPVPAPLLIQGAICILFAIAFLTVLKNRDERENHLRLISLLLGLSLGVTGINAWHHFESKPDPLASVCPAFPKRLSEFELLSEANAADIAPLPMPKNVAVRLNDIELTRDGKWILLVTWQGLCFYDSSQPRDQQPKFVPYQPEATSAIFSHDGRWLALGDSAGGVGVWEVIPGNPEIQIQVRWKLNDHSAPVTEIEFSRDNQILVSADGNGGLNLWSASNGNKLSWNQNGQSFSTIKTMAFSPSGNSLILALEGGGIGVWDDNNEELLVLDEDRLTSISALAFGSDRRFASGGKDNTVAVWLLLADGGLQQIRQLRGHTDTVLSIAFSPNGKVLASGGADQTIRLWNVETGEQIKELRGHSAQVQDLAFSADGKLLVSVGGDGKATLWGVPVRK